MEALRSLDERALQGLAVVGGLVVVRAALYVLGSLYVTFLRPAKNLKKYGQWAVITGATDGIGKAMTLELAKRGMNVLLISRTQSKLDDTAAEMRKACPNVTVECLAIDYSAFDKAAEAKVGAAMAGKDVGILLNGVGMSYPFPKYFDELTDEEMDSLIKLNVDSTVRMTRLALPGMVERKRGAIVNYGSAAALNPSALLAGYAGCKGFILKMSETMNVEMAPKGIHVQCQVPLMVATKLAKVRKPSWDKPSPKAYAAAGVKAIGYEMTTSPYWSHRLQLFVMASLPSGFVNNAVFGIHKGLRARALKKLAAKKD